MHRTWQLQEAKNKLSEVVDRALAEGPQIISRRGRETVVVVSIHDFRGLQSPETSLVDFFRSSPLRGVNLDLERDRDAGREIDLDVSD